MSDIEFPGGVYAAKPAPSNPEWIKALIDIRLEDAIKFLEQKKAEGETKIQLELRESKQGKFYVAINHWKPSADRNPKLSVVPPSVAGGGNGAIPQ